MAKPLTITQPSSSVAKLLEPGVGQAAVRPTFPPHEPQRAGEPAGVPAGPRAGTREFPPTGEPANVKREFVLTASSEESLRRLLVLYERATGAKLTGSHLLRALLRAVDEALPEIERAASGLGPLKRPSNARGGEAGREEFERRLAESLLAGMRECRRPR